jgi:hypothetical protein
MNPEQWRRISSLFHGALAQAPDLRKAFLDQACGADANVREEVERLLRAHQNAGAFGEMPLQPAGVAASAIDLGLSPPEPPTLSKVTQAPRANRGFLVLGCSSSAKTPSWAGKCSHAEASGT